VTDIREAAARWARTWTKAWEALDVEPIVALYAPDGVWVAEPIVDGNLVAISWWAALREDDTDATLAGTSVLRYDEDGLVIEQWDTWNVLAEKRSPPSGWSPSPNRTPELSRPRAFIAPGAAPTAAGTGYPHSGPPVVDRVR
jgi:hypothetical protein